jgi:CBS domain containing-hemolysin-like protein
LAVLLTLSAFFSASETALFSLSRAQVRRLREAGGRTGRAAAALLARPRRLLITILVGNMVVNVAAASIVAALVIAFLGEEAVGLAIFGSTLLLLVFGEVTPKTFAVRHAQALARGVALPLELFGRLVWPVRWLLRHVTHAVLTVVTRGRVHADESLTKREFEAAFEVGEAEGVISEHEREMVTHIFAFRTALARELMVPRTQMVCVDERLAVAEAAALSHRSGHARLPVHSGELDDVWGVFDARDLPAWRGHGVEAMSLREFVAYRDRLVVAPGTSVCGAPPSAAPKGEEARTDTDGHGRVPLSRGEREAGGAAGAGADAPGDRPGECVPLAAPRWPLVRPALLVPEGRHAGELLHDLRTSGTHLAILVDEYGGTAGLVTLQQLVDELVGGVLATGRDGQPLYAQVGDAVHVRGEVRIRDANHDLGLGLPLGVADTVGGYVMSLFGDLPREGEETTDGRFRYAVVRLAGRCIDAVAVRGPLRERSGRLGRAAARSVPAAAPRAERSGP